MLLGESLALGFSWSGHPCPPLTLVILLRTRYVGRSSYVVPVVVAICTRMTTDGSQRANEQPNQTRQTAAPKHVPRHDLGSRTFQIPLDPHTVAPIATRLLPRGVDEDPFCFPSLPFLLLIMSLCVPVCVLLCVVCVCQPLHSSSIKRARCSCIKQGGQKGATTIERACSLQPNQGLIIHLDAV